MVKETLSPDKTLNKFINLVVNYNEDTDCTWINMANLFKQRQK